MGLALRVQQAVSRTAPAERRPLRASAPRASADIEVAGQRDFQRAAAQLGAEPGLFLRQSAGGDLVAFGQTEARVARGEKPGRRTFRGPATVWANSM